MHAAEIPKLQSYNGATPMLRQVSISVDDHCTFMTRMLSPGPTLPCTQSCASAARAFLTGAGSRPSVAALP